VKVSDLVRLGEDILHFMLKSYNLRESKLWNFRLIHRMNSWACSDEVGLSS
jgi:hypothetical protein